jgi:hypothetical protein
MPQVTRDTLESPLPLRQAEYLLNEFFNDHNLYPDDEFYMRKGICKVLADEFHPLVRLAQSFWGVRSVFLLPQSNPGPDAKITFWWRKAAMVQITCSTEDYNNALEREQLFYKGSLLLHQQWKRDKKTRSIVPNGKYAFEPSVDVQVRVDRILKAIYEKERKYYSGTAILLIHEDSANLEYLQEGRLHEQVRDRVSTSKSLYRRIYVNYGDNIRRVK